MTDIDFEVLAVEPDPYAAAPTLLFTLRLTESTGTPIHSLALRCQLRIEPQKRRYTHDEEERLLALFGETPRWGDTLKPFLWTHASTMVAGFTGAVVASLGIFTPIYLGVVIPGRWFIRHKNHLSLKAFVRGATAAAAGAIGGATIVLTRQAIKDWSTLAIGLVAIFVLWRAYWS